MRIGDKVILIWGDQDEVSPIAVGQYLKDLFQYAELKIIQGGEHDLANRYAEQVAKEIMLYLNQIDTNTEY